MSVKTIGIRVGRAFVGAAQNVARVAGEIGEDVNFVSPALKLIQERNRKKRSRNQQNGQSNNQDSDELDFEF